MILTRPEEMESNMEIQQIEGIPGLYLAPQFFTQRDCEQITAETLHLYTQMEANCPPDNLTKAPIPQPEYFRSEEHNLKSEEYFARLKLDDPVNAGGIRCEYFPRYGEVGHALGYLRGNNNMPAFVTSRILPRIKDAIKSCKLIDSDEGLRWKLTVNVYKNSGGVIAGFPFHVDIPANGVVTMILNVQREALFQIAKEERTHDIQLPVGGVLILSGESRYEWKHRVVPTPSPGSTSEDEVERVSLVLGYQ